VAAYFLLGKLIRKLGHPSQQLRTLPLSLGRHQPFDLRKVGWQFLAELGTSRRSLVRDHDVPAAGMATASSRMMVAKSANRAAFLACRRLAGLILADLSEAASKQRAISIKTSSMIEGIASKARPSARARRALHRSSAPAHAVGHGCCPKLRASVLTRKIHRGLADVAQAIEIAYKSVSRPIRAVSTRTTSAMNDPTLPLPGLSPVAGKSVVAKFDGGLLSSCNEIVSAECRGGVINTRQKRRLATRFRFPENHQRMTFASRAPVASASI